MIYDSLEPLTLGTQDNTEEAQMDLLNHDWIYWISEAQDNFLLVLKSKIVNGHWWKQILFICLLLS